MEEQQDHVWRFALESRTSPVGYEDPLVEMVRAFLDDFLNIGYLTKEGRKVGVDGFTFLNDPGKSYRVFLDNAESGDGGNPRAPSTGVEVGAVRAQHAQEERQSPREDRNFKQEDEP